MECLTSSIVDLSLGLNAMRAMPLPTSKQLFAVKSRDVTAGVPTRMPLVTKGDSLSPGIVFLFIVILPFSDLLDQGNNQIPVFFSD